MVFSLQQLGNSAFSICDIIRQNDVQTLKLFGFRFELRFAYIRSYKRRFPIKMARFFE